MDRKTTPPARPDKGSDTGPNKGRTREDRLKSALKANLARRKAQIRGRGEADAGRDADTATETDKD
ncbi:hypothetical protein [Thioalkalivibrio sp.]|uniref:hypothetical protein n=1 Tax=Thioalkalivibrio sp. TaxID=2093813 RepID=UPI003975C9D7